MPRPSATCTLKAAVSLEAVAASASRGLLQPQHPAAALGIELVQDPGTCPRHAVSPVPLFDSAGTLAYLRRAFSAEMRQNPREP
jgi:hypothetical protein